MTYFINGSSKSLIDDSGIVLSFEELHPLPDFLLDSYKPGTGTNNLVLSLGGGGTFDSSRILHPCAVQKDDIFYLFYSGYNGSIWRIGVATGSISGFTGTNIAKNPSNPILSNGSAGQWDKDGVLDPWVTYDQDANLWKMWYRGISGTSQAIGYASSSSPYGTWTKHANNPIINNEVAWEGNISMMPNVLKLDSNYYLMFYSGNEPASNNARIGYATSIDGINWTKYASNPVLSPSGSGWMAASVFSPRTLFLQNGIYKIYYSGKQSGGGASKCGYAYSNNLINWTVDAVNPILTPTRSWEGSEVENPNAIHIGSNWYIYFDCYFGSPSSIGVAIVPD